VNRIAKVREWFKRKYSECTININLQS
jgi:hypothetical protein